MAATEYITLNIRDYSISPGPRYCIQGDDSGEDFYHTRLNKEFYSTINQKKNLRIILDGPDGYASSFLDEAFGNLVYDFGIEIIKKTVEIISDEEPEWISMIENNTYEEWENRRIQEKTPKITKKHSPWFRLIGDKIEQKEWISEVAQ